MRLERSVFSLFRIQSLLLVVASMYLVRHAIIVPVLGGVDSGPLMSEFHFSLLVISVVLIGFAGYVINDYFDVAADASIRPGKNIIARGMKRRYAIVTHIVLTTAGVGLGVYLGYNHGNIRLATFHVIAAAIMWFYSTGLKNQFVISNLVIALLSAMSVMIVGAYEDMLFNMLSNRGRAAAASIWILILSYSFFAFLLVLIRDVMKDAELLDEHSSHGRSTLPVVLGSKQTKQITFVLCGIASIAIVWGSLSFLFEYVKMMVPYVIITVLGPLIFLIYKLYYAESKEDYRYIKHLAGFIIWMGVFSMSYIWLSFN